MNLYAHICGFSGAGKTTLGEKIKVLHPSLEMKDIDDFFFDEDTDDYAERKILIEGRISEYILSVSPDKKIVLVGTGCVNAVPEEFIAISPRHKIWFDISLEESCTRAIRRQIEYMYENREEIIEMMKEMTLFEINEYHNRYMNYQTRMMCWGPLKDIAMMYGYNVMNEEGILGLMKSENTV